MFPPAKISCAIPVDKYCFILYIVLHGIVVGTETENSSATSPPNDVANISKLHKNDYLLFDKILSNNTHVFPISHANYGYEISTHNDTEKLVHNETNLKDANSSTSKSTIRGVSKTQTWYKTSSWLANRGIKQDKSVNLAVLPMLAILFFVFGVCIRCYSWVRDQDRTKARGQLDFEDDEVNYSIITAGEQGYHEVDIRSDCTSMYDTVNSFRSLRLPFNDHTVTSIKSLPNQPYETYRSILLQRANEGVYDSVHSYKAFLEQNMHMNEVDIEVELVDDYRPRQRSKSFGSENNPRPKKRRLRHYSGSRIVEGSAKTPAEKERFRRHSDKSSPLPPHPESIRSKTFHRRSSPAILEPLFQGQEFKIPLEQSDDEQEYCSPSHPHSALDQQSSSSASSAEQSSSSSCRRKESSYKHRREKLRQKRSSQDRLAERRAKGSSHSSGHCSDDSPRSSSSSKGSSSNELDSESDVTDSGLVMDLPKPTEKSCFKKNGRDISRSQSPCDLEGGTKNGSRKVHRFKVSFVDDATLSATSE